MAEFAHDGVGMGKEIVAGGCSAIDDYVGEEDGVVSDNGVFVDDYIGAEVRILAYLRFGMDDRGGMDPRGVGGRAVEKFQGLGPSQVGVLAAQHAGWYGGEAFRDDDG